MTTLETLADQVQPTETPAPAAAEQPKSVSTEPSTDGGDGDESSQEAPKDESKSFSQEEVDEMIRKRVAKAEARAERRVMRALERIAPAQAPQLQQPQSQDDGRPTRAQYASEEAFIDALTDWKLDQREQRARSEQVQSKQREVVTKTETLYAEASKVDGFDRESFDELPLTPTIVQILLDSDVAPRLMAHMAANPEEVERIARLPAHRQAAEIGKLEDRITAAKPSKPSNAPRPIAPVGARGSAAATDPERMSMAEYAEMRKQKGPLWHLRKT